MKQTFTILALTVLTLLAFKPQVANASHAMGADMTFKCLGNNQYEVTLQFYRDCAGVSAPTSASVTATSSCGQSISLVLTRDPIYSALEVTPLCPAMRKCSRCNVPLPAACMGVMYPGVEVYTYRGVVTLPYPCHDWRIAYNLCCRNNAISNLQSPSSQTMYLDILINNMDTLCVSSPSFAQLPTPYICNNEPYNYNHSVTYASNPGDSIVYELVQARTAGSTPINFTPPRTATDPMPTVTGLSFNQINGQLFLIPNTIGHYVMVVRVSVYRNGILISQVHRDIQVVVIDCPGLPSQVQLSDYQNVGGGGYVRAPFSVGVCPGNTLTFDVYGTTTPPADSVWMSSNFTNAFPGATFVVNGHNPAIGTFSWTPTGSDIGSHYFVVTAWDNNCPVSGYTSRAYEIVVLDTIGVSPDTTFCLIGGPVRLHAYGGSSFTWWPSSSIVGAAPDSSWVDVFPSQTTTYSVTSDCDDTATVTVTLVPSFNYTISPNDSICRFETSNLWVDPEPTHGPFTFSWVPDYRLDTNGVSAVTAMPFNTTTYTLTMTSVNNCTVVDSVEVYIKGEAPRVTLTPDKVSLCPGTGDSVKINFMSIPSLCGPSATGCPGSKVEVELGDQTGLSNIPTPFMGNYKFYRMQILYTRQELNALGIFGGTISSISFNVGLKQSNRAYQEYMIRMKCTELEALGDNYEENLDVVFAPTNRNTVNGWNKFNFTTAYDWDGFTNLIVEICFSTNLPGGPGNNDQVYFTPTSTNSVLFRMSDNAGPGCNLILPIPSNRRPNTIFEVCGQPILNYDITWTPPFGVSDPKIADPFISGLSQTTTFNVEIDNVGCISNTSITIYVDSTVLDVTRDTLLCDTIPFELRALATGLPPNLELSCGANNTAVLFTPDTMRIVGGNTSFAGTLFQGNVTDMRFQVLLRATDLRAMGMRTGVINSLSMQLGTKTSTNPARNFSIKMGCTADNDLTTTAFIPAPHTVYTNAAYSTNTGWNTWVFSNPYDWDGTSNIVLDFCWDNPSNTFMVGSDNLIGYSVTYNAIGRAYGINSTPGCNLTNPSIVYRTIPNFTFTVAEPPPGEFEYIWTDLYANNFLATPDSANTMSFTYEPGTTYHVQTTTKFGCLLQDSVTVDVKVLTVDISTDTAICLGETAGVAVTGGDTYQWLPQTPDVVTPNAPATLVTPTNTTTYTVQISDAASGCLVEQFVTVTVNPIPVVDAGISTNILIGQTTVLNGLGGPDWFWEPEGSLDNANSGNPNAQPYQTTTYTLTVVDANGCTMWDTVTIFVESIDDVFIPNAFSPNGDGVNDVFYIVPFGLTDLENFVIVNRWGEVVFRTNDFSQGWDGRVNGTPQPLGTYVYFISGFDYKGDPVTRQGNITLVR